MDHLWAGWRSTYIASIADPDAEAPCLFCRLPAGEDSTELILSRGDTAFSVLNRFPYTTGHLMVAPYRHIAAPGEADGEEILEMWDLLEAGRAALLRAMQPHGFNVGANLGRVAGAGVPGHLHLHLVPRWDGDTNFMTTVGTTRVLPEDLADTWERLRDATG